jgi:pyruvate dehydrogenase E2 component (dihydrolipoamide acetyltransferase)
MVLRKKYAENYKKKEVGLTITVFALKAIVSALKKFPNFNASFDSQSGELILKNYYHIGVAVDTEAGLIVPVIRDVDKKSLLQLAKELGEVAEKARNRSLKVEELQGSTFTISNLGGLGVGHFTPIVNYPEVAILGLGRGVIKPVHAEDKWSPRNLVPLALSYDHRVIDGADGARFIREFAKDLETFPESEVKIK